MIAATLTITWLWVHAPMLAVAAVPGTDAPAIERGAMLSVPQKRAAVRPLVFSATACIAQAVAADSRFANASDSSLVNELIVDSMPVCRDVVHRMIDAYDRLFGLGAGEAYFMGPYLDELPAAVGRIVRESQ
jgi:hypothetical protein